MALSGSLPLWRDGAVPSPRMLRRASLVALVVATALFMAHIYLSMYSSLLDDQMLANQNRMAALMDSIRYLPTYSHREYVSDWNNTYYQQLMWHNGRAEAIGTCSSARPPEANAQGEKCEGACYAASRSCMSR